MIGRKLKYKQLGQAAVSTKETIEKIVDQKINAKMDQFKYVEKRVEKLDMRVENVESYLEIKGTMK